MRNSDYGSKTTPTKTKQTHTTSRKQKISSGLIAKTQPHIEQTVDRETSSAAGRPLFSNLSFEAVQLLNKHILNIVTYYTRTQPQNIRRNNKWKHNKQKHIHAYQNNEIHSKTKTSKTKKKTEGKHENQKKQPKYPKTKDLINIVSL